MIRPTCELDRAADGEWDVCIVGGGPAGALAAREAARGGARVLLIDQAEFPRYKVCGGCINGHALATLQAVGLGDVTQRLGATPLNNLRLASGRRMAELALPGGVSLSRSALDAALVQEAIAAGASFLPGVRASVGDVVNDARKVVLKRVQGTLPNRGEAGIAAKVVVIATGLGGENAWQKSQPHRETTAGAYVGAGAVVERPADFYAPAVIHMACGLGGYVGLVRVEDGQLNVATALAAERVRLAGGIAPAIAGLLEATGWPVPKELLAPGAWHGTPRLWRRSLPVAAERLLVVGDAGGYIEPFTGEGMAWALSTGRACVPLALAGVETWRPELEQAWRREHRKLVSRRQFECRMLARMLRHTRTCRAIIGILRGAPWLARPLVGRIHGSRLLPLAATPG